MIWMDHSLFIHLHTEGQFGCFQVSPLLVNKSAINIQVHGFVWTEVFNSLKKYQAEQLLDHMVRVCLVL